MNGNFKPLGTRMDGPSSAPGPQGALSYGYGYSYSGSIPRRTESGDGTYERSSISESRGVANRPNGINGQKHSGRGPPSRPRVLRSPDSARSPVSGNGALPASAGVGYGHGGGGASARGQW